jgi:hypothetical protein
VVFNPSILDDATTCKQGSDISQRKDITPNKTSGILHLLSSLNGLTPEGMAHLMETQDQLNLTQTAQPTKQSFKNASLGDMDDLLPIDLPLTI